MNDGIIRTDSKRGKIFGLTSDKFSGDTYLWKTGDTIMISFIFCKNQGRGNFSKLVGAIENAGFRVVVPTPLGKMVAILRKWGYEATVDPDDGCELWARPITD